MKTPERAFYVNPKNIQNKIFSLCEKESYHAAKVLRLKLGDTIVLVDGKSHGYFGLIEQIKPKIVTGSIIKTLKNFGENQNTLHISPGLFKKNRFEILLEKATELGVKEIHPILMERSVKTSINIDRCNKILISAAKYDDTIKLQKIFAASTFFIFLSSKKNVISRKSLAQTHLR